uniref:DUF1542 domain-containing protein n=1 Tax=Streptococcus sp. 4477 TaxID=2582686 RepID=UPI0031F59DE5
MGSGAVSAEEAQTVQSNEEVAADKDSETEKKPEKQQPTYAAPAAKEQGSATNTEAGDEDSVSGDSSSPKSEGEGTRSEEASSKPKVRKRREAAPAPPATAADADSAANQTYQAPGEGANVEELAAKLKELPDTVENETKLGNIDQVGDTKNINQGEVKELDEFGGWKAVNGGKFAVAKKTSGGVFPIETVNTVHSSNGDTNHNWTWVRESVFDRSNNYALLLSKVRTKKNQNEETFDKSKYMSTGEGNGISKGLKSFSGIEKTFKVYTPKVGSGVTIEFKTGYTGDIDGKKAKYKVELKASKMDNKKTFYSVEFDPSQDVANEKMNVTKAKDGAVKPYFTTLRSVIEKSQYNTELEKQVNRPNGIPGKFKSSLIDIPAGYTDYTVTISSADNQHLGMGYQIDWEHYALPVTGEEFKVTQDTSKVAKDLSQKVYDNLIAQKEEDTKWSTTETKATYYENLNKIKEKINSGVSTNDYKTVVKDALEKWKQLNEEKQIKDKAKKAIADKLTEKEEAIENNSNLSPAEKEAAKKEAKAEADKAKQAIENAQTQNEVTEKETEGTAAIGNVNPIGTDNAKNAIAEAAARKMVEIDDNDKLSEDEKTAAKEKVEAAVTKAAQAIREAKDAKNQDGVNNAQADAVSKVTAINPVGKDKAKKAIADKLTEKEEAIDNNDKLSPREKAAAKEQAQAEADKARQAIENAQTQDDVDMKEAEGTKAIGNVNPIGTDNAVTAIAEVAARKMVEIDDNDKLSEDEKKAAKAKVEEAATKAAQAIKKAKDANNQGGVDKAQEDALSEVTAVKPVAKDKAKK